MTTRRARRYATAVAALALAACLGPQGTAAAERQILFDFDTGFDVANVGRSDCKAAVVKRDGGSALAVATGHKAPWPGVTLKAPGGRWDLSAFEGVALDVRNTGAGAVTVHCRVDSAGADGRNNCCTGAIDLKAGEAAALTVRLERTSAVVEGAKLFGMRACPVSGDGKAPGRIDPSEVIGLVIFVARPTEDHAFEIGTIRAEGSYVPPKEPRLTAETFFPFIDTFGQYIHRDWPGKTHAPADLEKAREAEEADLAAHPGPANWSAYGGWRDGPRQKATGFFYPAKHGGRWWLVDPQGCLFFSHGIDCVNERTDTPLDDRDAWWQDFPGSRPEFQEFFGRTGHVVRDYYQGRQPRTFNFGGANLKRKYGQAWRDQVAHLAHRRLRSWGLNTVGNWSDSRIYLLKKTPYCVAIHASGPPIEGSRGYWGKFKDPFHPAFAKNLKARMAGEAGTTAGDPMCIGYFVDNEIAWGNEVSLAVAALESPPDQPAKRAFLADLKATYGTTQKLNAAWGTTHASWDALAASTAAPDRKRAAADLHAFYDRIAEQYFKTCREAVKEVAPNNLYLGCRFAWVNDRAARVAAKYCDVVSYNQYKRSVADFRMPGGIDMPVIIGEFHFGALDRGMFHTGLVPVASQEARAEAYKAYVRGAVENPQIVGTHWFKYQDESTTGRPLDGENYQIGFLDVCDTPYPETVAACREVGCRLYPSNPPATKGETAMKRLDGLRWKPAWVSHLGCIEGCLDYLGIGISRPWLFGGTGHAFIINMHEVVCPSGPTAWKQDMICQLSTNLGYQVDRLFAQKAMPDFAARQEEAWKFVRSALDRGLPCFGWELDIPEFYVICGYDETGYYYSGPGCDDGKGPKAWKELGTSEIGCIDIVRVEEGTPADDAKVVKDALTQALKHAENPKEWIFPKYRSGPAGFDLWAEALEKGTANEFGHRYNAAVWHECREMAVAFLAEAQKRLSGKADGAFDEAVKHYTVVRDRLKAVAERHPFPFGVKIDETKNLKDTEAAKHVRAAAAERQGLAALKKIAAAL